jgi:hypothetical protein
VQRDVEHEERPGARAGLGVDDAVHAFQNLATHGQAQALATQRNAIQTNVIVGLLERREDRLSPMGRHVGPAVGHLTDESHVLAVTLGVQAHIDAALSGELHRIADQVFDYLLDTHPLGEDPQISRAGLDGVQRNALQLRLGRP